MGLNKGMVHMKSHHTPTISHLFVFMIARINSHWSLRDCKQFSFIYNIFILIICLYHSNLGDMCEKETNRRKEEKEENERRTRAMSHSVKGFKSFSSL